MCYYILFFAISCDQKPGISYLSIWTLSTVHNHTENSIMYLKPSIPKHHGLIEHNNKLKDQID